MQKALGMVTDSWGALALATTMLRFGQACVSDMPRHFGEVCVAALLGEGVGANSFIVKGRRMSVYSWYGGFRVGMGANEDLYL